MALTPGEILRQKREELKRSLEQVAADTSIRIHFLQAIEENRMGAIASQTQLRGFIRLYASYLGLDPREILEPSEASSQDAKASQVTVSEAELESKLPNKIKPPKKPKAQLLIAPKESQPAAEKESARIFKEIGAQLKQQREALGLSRSDIERQIKIRELYVFALENGDIDDLPSSVQGRGMLNNYAAFMSLDPEPLQLRFADGLQQRRVEKYVQEEVKKKTPHLRQYNAPITGWRRFLTPDLLLGGGVFVVLFVLIIWGAMQVIGSSRLTQQPTAGSISEILIGTDTPEAISSSQETPDVDITPSPASGETVSTASVDLLATITSVANSPIQIVVVAYQRAFLRVVSDSKEVFMGRIVPGNVYTFTGSSKISLSSGNAAAMQIYYNQQDLGILGATGQILSLDFTGAEMVTATPQFTAMPTRTPLPTVTQSPTETPTVTPTTPLPTVTPYRP